MEDITQVAASWEAHASLHVEVAKRSLVLLLGLIRSRYADGQSSFHGLYPSTKDKAEQGVLKPSYAMRGGRGKARYRLSSW